MKKTLLIGILVAFISLLVVNPTLAAVMFDPVTQVRNVGDSVYVDILVDNVVASGEAITAFDMDVTYDSSIITATGVQFGSLLGDLSMFEAIAGSDISTPGLIDLWEVSLLSDADLQALQTADPINLATLSFTADNVGTSPLDFVWGCPNILTGLNGQDITSSHTPLSGSVTVRGPGPAVPEPATIILFGLSLIALPGLKKKVM